MHAHRRITEMPHRANYQKEVGAHMQEMSYIGHGLEQVHVWSCMNTRKKQGEGLTADCQEKRR